MARSVSAQFRRVSQLHLFLEQANQAGATHALCTTGMRPFRNECGPLLNIFPYPSIQPNGKPPGGSSVLEACEAVGEELKCATELHAWETVGNSVRKDQGWYSAALYLE